MKRRDSSAPKLGNHLLVCCLTSDIGIWCLHFREILGGFFSVVSTPISANKGLSESSLRDLFMSVCTQYTCAFSTLFYRSQIVFSLSLAAWRLVGLRRRRRRRSQRTCALLCGLLHSQLKGVLFPRPSVCAQKFKDLWLSPFSAKLS